MRRLVGSLLVCGGIVALGCGPSDPSVDGGGGCACDDGDFCNGEESCDAEGECIAAASPCSAMQTCDESADRCVSRTGCDVDGDGDDALVCGGSDCDDEDPARSGDATEVCDEDDEDCDFDTVGEMDTDGDGAVSLTCCNGGSCGADCDDGAADVHPTANEVCDGVDQDCDGAIDEGLSAMTYTPDCDRDLFGEAGATAVTACTTPAAPPAGCAGGTWSTVADDCDDTDVGVSPGATDFCDDAVDSDCDPATDGATLLWYRDADDDGFYGALVDEVSACSRPAGHAHIGGDCNDAAQTTYPAAPEACDGVDNDCDTVVDDLGADDWCTGRVPHATPECADGACAVGTCDSGYDDCNGVVLDGCEVFLASNRFHCGVCRSACPTGDFCMNGGCCASAFTYCPGAGCINLASDLVHCGACNNVCASGLRCFDYECVEP